MALAERISRMALKPYVIQPMALTNFLRQSEDWKATLGGVIGKSIVLRPVNIVV
jgi:hypothetical protein